MGLLSSPISSLPDPAPDPDPFNMVWDTLNLSVAAENQLFS